MLPLLACLALAALLVPGIALSQSQVPLYPMKAVFYETGTQSKLDKRLREGFDVAHWAQKFHESFSRAFVDNVVAQVSRNTAARTYFASFNISRASVYRVAKLNGTVDVVTPITGSLYFTNAITGEVLFTLSRTSIGRRQASTSDGPDAEAQIRAELTRTLEDLIEELVKEAKAKFAVRAVNATIIGAENGLLILNAGRKAGLALRDKLDDASKNLIEVVYLGDSYSVARAVLASNVGLGATFQKFVTATNEQNERQPLVVLSSSLPADVPEAYIRQLFGDLLGDKAKIPVVHVNPTFASLLTTIVADVDLDQGAVQNRTSPELYLKLSVPDPVAYEATTNLRFQKRRRYEAIATADIVDRSGRIVYSAIGRDKIEDIITNGAGPAVEDRKDAVLKNALGDLADNLAKMAIPRREQFDVKSSDQGTVLIENPGRFIAPGQPGMVLRRAKATLKERIEEPVWIPVQEGAFAKTADPITTFNATLPVGAAEEKIEPGYKVELLAIGTRPRTLASAEFCKTTESLGSFQVPAFQVLSQGVTAQRMPALLYDREAAEIAQKYIGPESGFAQRQQFMFPDVPVCLEYVQRIDTAVVTCDSSLCHRPATVRLTIRAKSGAQVLGRQGIESQMRSSSLPEGTPDSAWNQALVMDLWDEGVKLMQVLSDKLALPTNQK